MLRELRLHHYAIIDNLSISFSEGLNVITGETGAGKSILVEALALLLGERADVNFVRDESDEAILEGYFDSSTQSSDLYENDPDGLIVRRILSKSKSRAYLNGALATISTLKQVGQSLAEIHGQHDQYQLMNPDYPLLTLDAYGKLLEQRSDFLAQFQEYSHLLNEIADLKKELYEKEGEARSRQKDFISYQLSEIFEADLKPGEEESLEKEDFGFKNRETILSAVEQGYATLSEEGGVLSQIGTIEQSLRSLQEATRDAEAERQLLDTAKIHLKELAVLFRDRSSSISYDEERQKIVTERIYFIQKMKKKYGGSTTGGGSVEATLAFESQLKDKLLRLSEREMRLPELEKLLEAITEQLTTKAQHLSKKRKETIGRFEKKVKEELDALGMEKTHFKIAVGEKPISQDGIDQVSFLIALPGESPKPISKVASGGELSRIMLAIKVALADIDPVPTFVFDEVDAGIGGAVAERIGKRLVKLSKAHQVFCITHLPQIARFADHHYLAEKKTDEKRTTTTVKKLSKDERVLELARMLGGVEMTDATLRHAKELGNYKSDED
ncbi:MAG: DNA repair protein RecN [Nitrospirota bacterium]